MYYCNHQALPVSQVQIAGYAYQINYLAYLVEKLQQDVANLDPESQGEAITTLQNNVGALQDAVGALQEEIEGISPGGNMFVEVPSQMTCADNNIIYLTYDKLPEGAVLDKIELSLNLSGLTAPTKVDILVTAVGGVSTVADGGYASWNISSNTSGNVTISTLTLGLNTLFTHNITSSDAVIWGRIYYHI